jgi:PAS domain S-box-containing protein
MNPSDKVNILLVDDRPENLLALEAILEPLHQNLVRANSGPEALKWVLAREFAVILMDVQMPGMNGFECAQLIKARERSKHIPIIFLTAISKEEEYVFQGYTVGAVDYLAKPFNPDILRSKVSVFVDLYLKNQHIKRQEQMLRESERRELELVHNARLHESELRLAEVVDSALDAILMFDDEQRITLFNSAAERMFGVVQADVLGKPVDQLLPQYADRHYVERVCREGSTGEHSTKDSDQRAPDAPHVEALSGRRGGKSGVEFPVEASISCLEIGSHKVYTVIARDITQRQQAEEALRTQAVSLANSAAELKALNQQLHQRQVELERAMSARSRFYASMSHELRTPINAILGYNTLMLENIYGPLNERQVHGLQRTQKAAKHLLELVNDVLDLSKIEAGKIEVQLQPVTFPALIEDLFITVRPMADERGSQLSLEHPGEPVTVITDPRRVRQILLNLLSNAIKFGRGNPIRVRSIPGEEGGVSISVEDRGEGIANEDLPRIFDEFVQLAHAHDHEGTGLGLPISKRLATLLNGSLDAESKVNEGSTFTLVLPKTADASIRIATPVSPQTPVVVQSVPAPAPKAAPQPQVTAR